MNYKIDFHVHTNKSFDGISSLEKLIESAKAKGLNGLAVTDHNICTVIPKLKQDDFLLIPGCEVSTKLGHVTALFIEKDIEVSKRWQGELPDAKEAVQAIHECGGLAVLAHPYNKNGKVYDAETIGLFDGVEVYNARACFKNTKANEMAHHLADEYACRNFAGSDAHSKDEVGNAYALVEARSLTLVDIKRAVLANQVKGAIVKNTCHMHKGRSQFVKALRTKNILKVLKACAYVVYCIGLDIFKGR